MRCSSAHLFYPELFDEEGGSVQNVNAGRVKFQWLFDTEQPTHVGHKLLQAFEKGDLLLAVHCGWCAAGCQLVEGIGQPLVDDGVSLRGQQSLHKLRVLCLKENRIHKLEKKIKKKIYSKTKTNAHSRKLKGFVH